MAGGAILTPGGKDYPGKLTANVLITCIIAATGGLIFGYDLGISGGVTSMDSFLKEFFPSVYAKESSVKPSDNQYCKFDSQILTLFTSSLYLAALVASLFAATVTQIFGRRTTMLSGGVLFCVGALINGFAQRVWMLIVGRLFLGFGIGCANQSVPIYVSEMAPYRFRGGLNMMFQLAITIGMLVANLLNYFFAEIKGGWGWRLSLGGAMIPAIIIIIGSFFLPETPNSLIEFAASEASKLIKHPWATILERKYRPQLTMAICIPMFQQHTGMNVITFYTPVLFKTIGFGSSASLMSAVITGTVNALATLVSIFSVDKWGRRTLFLEGGAQMFICQVIITIAIASRFGTSGNPGELPTWSAYGLVFFICVYVSGFAWSWGPLGWLVPSEIFPLEVRSAAQAINVSVNMIFTFGVAQVFTLMLCHLKFGLFIFFAFWVLIMSFFIFKYLPETKGVPIEEMSIVWRNHPIWGKYVPPQEENRIGGNV
ncbi:hypothetical protein ACB094_12G156600 [Castanea mollissima]